VFSPRPAGGGRGVLSGQVERVLPVELSLLADVFGPESRAAEALGVVHACEQAQVLRAGRWLLIFDSGDGGDTVVIRRFW
jgi:hypothetical protein